MYTVEFHKGPEEEPPPPRWDASRKAAPPPPTREKLRRVLKEEAQRSRHQAGRVAAYTKRSWDSPRPAGGDLPHFSLAWSAADEPAYLRDDEHFAGRIEQPWSFLADKERRVARCPMRGSKPRPVSGSSS